MKTDAREIIPEMTDDELISLYTDPASHPAIEIKPNVVMIVGTGGIGIWERTWRETAHALTGKSEYELLSDANVTGPIRAMYIAKAAAFRSSQSIQKLSLQFYWLTPSGGDIGKNFLEIIPEGPTREKVRAQWAETFLGIDALATAYMDRHPQDGHQRFYTLENVATDTLETGQHLIYLALHKNNPELLYHGRSLATTASKSLITQVKTEGRDKPTIQEATRGDTEAERAMSYVNLITRICKTGDGALDDSIRSFAATSYIARWAHAAGTRTMERLHDLGSKDGGLPSTARHLSDEIFYDRKHGFVRQALEALTQNQHQEANTAFAALERVEETLSAIAYGEMVRVQANPDTPESSPTQDDLLRSINSTDLTELARIARDHEDWEKFYNRSDR